MKRVGSHQYVHRSAISQLSTRDQRRVASLAGELSGFAWTVARVGPTDVMLGRTTSWDRDDHPALSASVTLKGNRMVVRSYAGNSRPVYHRCETMLNTDHPRYAHFRRLSAREAAAGSLSRPDIGTVGAWRRLHAR